MKKIEYDDWDEIEKYFIKKGIYSYYCSFPTFYSHFVKGIYSAYSLNNKIIIQKYNTNPRIYILDDLTQDEYNQILLLKPLFIQKILLTDKHELFQPEFIFNNEEIIRDLDKSLFKNIRNGYNYVKKHYDSIIVENLDLKHKQLIQNFIIKWKQQHSHYFRLTYKRDIFLLDCIDKLFGTIILKDDEIIGLEINYPHPVDKGMCINILRKHDITYKNLHDFLKIEGCKTCLKNGFKWSNDCNSTDNNLKKYKTKFLGKTGYMYNLYSTMIYKKINEKKMENINLIMLMK